jgi:creatinine amidohydrolase
VSVFFGTKTHVELSNYIKKNAIILFPIGQVEEHGLHLPVDTDTVIATKIAELVAERIKDEIPVLILPTYWCGFSPSKMKKWPGVISVRPKVVIDVISDVCSSVIDMGFKKIVLIDSHGQHRGILEVVVREIIEKRNIYMALTSPAVFSSEVFKKVHRGSVGSSSHAGEWETSVMLYFKQKVDMSKLTDIDRMKYRSEFINGDFGASGSGKKVFMSSFGYEDSKTGVLGDPTEASEETGKQIVNVIVESYYKFLKEFYTMQIYE